MTPLARAAAAALVLPLPRETGSACHGVGDVIRKLENVCASSKMSVGLLGTREPEEQPVSTSLPHPGSRMRSWKKRKKSKRKFHDLTGYGGKPMFEVGGEFAGIIFFCFVPCMHYYVYMEDKQDVLPEQGLHGTLRRCYA